MSPSTDDLTPSQHIDKQIADLNDWRGARIGELRRLIHEAVPDIVEEWKWDTAVWSQKGMLCSAGAFKDHVKLNFFKGASLQDPRQLFNAGLEAKASRAIDWGADDPLDAAALKDLVRAAAAFNQSGGKKK